MFSPLASILVIVSHHQDCVNNMGHTAFAILVAVPDIGVIIVPIVGIFTLLDKPVLATGLVCITMSPFIIPLLKYLTILVLRMGRTTGAVTANNLESGNGGGEPRS